MKTQDEKCREMDVQTLVRTFLYKGTGDRRQASLGYPNGEWNKLIDLIEDLYSRSLDGDYKAMDRLLTIGGLTGEEIRKNAEMERKDRESEARIEMMKAKMPHDQDGDDNGCVHIYLPEIEKLEEDDEDEELE